MAWGKYKVRKYIASLTQTYGEYLDIYLKISPSAGDDVTQCK